jgi:hypothetical protein
VIAIRTVENDFIGTLSFTTSEEISNVRAFDFCSPRLTHGVRPVAEGMTARDCDQGFGHGS